MWTLTSGIDHTVDAAGYVYGDFKFDTWFLKHKLTVGLQQSELNCYEEDTYRARPHKLLFRSFDLAAAADSLHESGISALKPWI